MKTSTRINFLITFHRSLITFAVLSSVLCPLSSVFSQGSLTPPGAPAPTMKTLDQIQPRIDLQSAPASAVDTTNASYQFIINQPGSYYLTANIAATKPNAIQINVADVTLDLNGFEISHASGTNGSGIEIPATSHRASIHDGSIKGFFVGIKSLFASNYAYSCGFRNLTVSGCSGTGIFAGFGAVLESCRADSNSGIGIAIRAGEGSTLVDCTASANSTTVAIQVDGKGTLVHCVASNNTLTGAGSKFGISAGAGSSLMNCVADNNTADVGIRVADGCALSNCVSNGNTATFGIQTGGGCSLNNCSARSNSSSASSSFGIQTGSNCTLSNCVATSNTSTNGSLTDTTGVGIAVADDCSLNNCTADQDKGDGIELGDRCQIIACVSNGNGSGTNGSGIVAGLRTIVLHNNASLNQKSGIVVLGASLVEENNVGQNGAGGAAAGIDSSGGSGSRIEANVARNNTGTGILGASNDVIIRNYSFSNTTNYNPTSGNNFGPIELPSTSTHPTANF